MQDDPLTEVLDVIGQNEYIGWYEGRPEDADAKMWTFPNKPVIMTEFGAEAKFGDHGPPNQHLRDGDRLPQICDFPGKGCKYQV